MCHISQVSGFPAVSKCDLGTTGGQFPCGAGDFCGLPFQPMSTLNTSVPPGRLSHGEETPLGAHMATVLSNAGLRPPRVLLSLHILYEAPPLLSLLCPWAMLQVAFEQTLVVPGPASSQAEVQCRLHGPGPGQGLEAQPLELAPSPCCHML